MSNKRGRPRKETTAISQPTLTDMLAYFADYPCLTDDGRPFVFRAAALNTDDALQIYHGAGETADQRIEAIGLRGKLYALYILERHATRLGKTVHNLSNDIIDLAAKSLHQPEKDREARRKLVLQAFRDLLSTSNIKSVPDLALAKDMIEHAVVYFGGLIGKLGSRRQTTEIQDELRTLLSQLAEFPDVETFYKNLIETFGIEKQFQRNRNAASEPLRFVDWQKQENGKTDAKGTDKTKSRPNETIPLSWVDEDFLQQLSDGTRTYPEEDPGSELSELAKSVLAQLADQSTRKRLVLLQGAPHSGKKSVIAEILREIDKLSSAPTRFLRLHDRTAPKAILPVMAIVARSRDQNALALYIRAFLQRMDDIQKDVRPYWARLDKSFPDLERYHTELLKQAREAGGSASTERTLAEIARLSAVHPAFYIFADLDGLGRDSILKLLRGYDATRLLNILSNNRQTRIVISAYDRSAAPEIRLDLDESSVLTEPLPNPALSRMDRYWSNKKVAEPIKEELDLVWKDVMHPLGFSQRNRLVQGESLVLCAALLQLCVQEKEVHGDLLASVLEAITAFAKSGNQQALTSDLTEMLVDIFDHRKLLPVMCLIAAAEDGILQQTLTQSLRIWHSGAPVSCPRFSSREVKEKLHVFRQLAGGFLLRREKNVRLDEHEFGLGETDWGLEKALTADEFHPLSDEDVKGFRVWSLDPAVRVSLIKKLQEPTSKFSRLFREANRIVALAARRRAQHKKVNQQAPFSTQPQMDSARDIQAYVCLLASMTKDEILGERHADASLMSSTESVFSIGSNFKGGVALRFAYFALLREEIDRDYRLSMVSDQDILRLRLYLLLLLPTGRHHFGFIGDMPIDGSVPADLPTTLPKHLTRTLEPEAIVAICATVAISALHAHYPQVIDYIQGVLGSYLKEFCGAMQTDKYPVVDGMIEDIAQVWLAKLDLMIAFRTRLEEGQGMLKTLLGLKIFKNLTLHDAKNNLAFLDQQDGLRILKVWMRLKFREGEFLFLKGEFESAQSVFDDLVTLDNFVSGEEGLLEPLIFGGRTARRYVKYVFGDAFLGPLRVLPPAVIDSAKAMIETNISRQRKFAGVDRIGVLIDLARRHAFEQNMHKALGYITNANVRARRGPMSHLARSELLTSLSTIRIWCAVSGEIDEGERRRFLSKARESASKLINLSDATHSEYFRAVGRVLSAKAYVETVKLPGSPYDSKTSTRLHNHITQLSKSLADLRKLGEVVCSKAAEKLIDEIEALPTSSR